MALINENFLKLPESYLFSDIKKKVEAFKHLHPDANIISLGIGDVTRPIAPVVIEALHAAVDEMGDSNKGTTSYRKKLLKTIIYIGEST